MTAGLIKLASPASPAPDFSKFLDSNGNLTLQPWNDPVLPWQMRTPAKLQIPNVPDSLINLQGADPGKAIYPDPGAAAAAAGKWKRPSSDHLNNGANFLRGLASSIPKIKKP